MLSQTTTARDHRTNRRLRFKDLDSTHSGLYKVQVLPMRHRPVSRFVRVLEGKSVQHSFVLPVDPDKVSDVKFPKFEDLGADLRGVLDNSAVEGHEEKRGAALYAALDRFRKAGLLNLYAKMKATKFPDGRDVFFYVDSLRRVRRERFFAAVKKELRDEVKNSSASNLFHQVSRALHKPRPGFELVDSFKTDDKYGNLQLTFFNKQGALEFEVDADIDDAQGIGHIFQVISHSITGEDTHPFDVHEILIQHQKIDPGYELIV